MPIAYVAGTSAGALVAAMLASGASGQELARRVGELNTRLLDYDYWGLLGRLLRPIADPPGLLRGKRMKEYLEKCFGHTSINELKLPFACMATDLVSARQVLFANRFVQTGPLGSHTEMIREASVLEAVLASMSIPGMFRPVVMGARLLVDGGLMDNCPVAALKAMGGERLIAVDLVSVKALRPARWTFSSILSRSISLSLHRMSKADAGYADLILAPDTGSIGILDFEGASRCMELGYECAWKHMPEIRRLLEQQQTTPGNP